MNENSLAATTLVLWPCQNLKASYILQSLRFKTVPNKLPYALCSTKMRITITDWKVTYNFATMKRDEVDLSATLPVVVWRQLQSTQSSPKAATTTEEPLELASGQQKRALLRARQRYGAAREELYRQNIAPAKAKIHDAVLHAHARCCAALAKKAARSAAAFCVGGDGGVRARSWHMPPHRCCCGKKASMRAVRAFGAGAL